jgi:hypothetical protein
VRVGEGISREESKRHGLSRKQVRQNTHMRKELHKAFDRVFKECLRRGWYGEVTLRFHVRDGVLQRTYHITTEGAFGWIVCETVTCSGVFYII